MSPLLDTTRKKQLVIYVKYVEVVKYVKAVEFVKAVNCDFKPFRICCIAPSDGPKTLARAIAQENAGGVGQFSSLCGRG